MKENGDEASISLMSPEVLETSQLTADQRETRFESWWFRLEGELLRRAAGYTRSTDASREIVQDLAILALQNVEKFSDFDDFKRWLSARLHWLALDAIRLSRREVYGTLSLDSSVEVDPRLVDRIAIQSALGTLPKRQQEVIQRYLVGDSPADIADELGLAEATVRSLLRFARIHLSRHLKGIG